MIREPEDVAQPETMQHAFATRRRPHASCFFPIPFFPRIAFSAFAEPEIPTMKRTVAGLAFALLAVVLLYTACIARAGQPSIDSGLPALTASATVFSRVLPPRRIVSLVPSLTETLLVLGLQDRLVGITDFCDHLPEAKHLPSVGSCLEPGIEAIAARKPDLVLYGPDQEPIAERLRRLGITAIGIRQIELGDIPLAIVRIGSLCGIEETAASEATRFRTTIEALSHSLDGRARPRILLAVGRDLSGGTIDQAFVAASGSYHDELLRLAGGENAWRGPALTPYPVITREGLMSLNPDLIIDLVPDPERQPNGAEGLLAAWRTVPGLAAIASDRVKLLTGAHVSIPGPNSAVQAAEQLIRLIHGGTK